MPKINLGNSTTALTRKKKIKLMSGLPPLPEFQQMEIPCTFHLFIIHSSPVQLPFPQTDSSTKPLHAFQLILFLPTCLWLQTDAKSTHLSQGFNYSSPAYFSLSSKWIQSHHVSLPSNLWQSPLCMLNFQTTRALFIWFLPALFLYIFSLNTFFIKSPESENTSVQKHQYLLPFILCEDWAS